MEIYYHAKTPSAAHASSSRYDVPSWTILFAGVIALLVVMTTGFAAGHEKHHPEHRHHPESQGRIVTKIPTDAAVKGASGTVHFLRVTLVPPEDVGRECRVAVKGINNKSVHPNSDLLVRTDTGKVILANIERAPNVRTEATNTLTIGTKLSVAVRLGPDGAFSGGLAVEFFDCVPPLVEIPADKIAVAGHGRVFDKYMNEIELDTSLITEIQDSMIKEILKAKLQAEITPDSKVEDAQELLESETLNVDETILIKSGMIGKLLQDGPEQLLAKYSWRNSALTSRHLALHSGLLENLRLSILNLLRRLDFFKPVTVSKTNYIADCRAHRVPIPPDWAESGTPWVFQGRLTQNLLANQPSLNVPPTQVEFAGVWTYSDPNVRGACIALPRGSGNLGSPAGIICESAETGHACFWDNKLRGIAPEQFIGWRGQTLQISRLKDGSNLDSACTQCHRGNNVFLMSPDDSTWAKLLRGPLSGPRTGTFTTQVEASTDIQGTPPHPRYIPITAVPERPGWQNLFSSGGCAGACHELPVVPMPIPMPPNCAQSTTDPSRCYRIP